ncbi:MAG: chorismate synthase [Elusimicrobiota bacterium]
MIRFLTCGESHGKMLSVIIDGFPAGMAIDVNEINNDLARRQKGHGRGSRSAGLEQDKAQIISGVRWGFTTGAPIGILIENRDWANRKREMSLDIKDKSVKYIKTKPRPGHADLAGALKYGADDITPILERASARSTASQVAAGSIFKQYLRNFGIETIAFTECIGEIYMTGEYKIKNINQAVKDIESSAVRCPDKALTKEMIKYIDEIKKAGDTLGGIIKAEAHGAPAGLGSYTQWDERIDAEIARALMSIPSIKGVEIGEASHSAFSIGSAVHDEIYYSKQKGYYRKTNRCGGVEGGITNGETVTAYVAVKPIPTLLKPLNSVDMKTKKSVKGQIVRSDVCVVPSAVVVVEAMMAYAIAMAHNKKFGGDNIEDTKKAQKEYLKRIK